jgi:predicted Zn-dependent protease
MLVAIGLLSVACAPAFGAAPRGDTVLQAMAEELERSHRDLRLEGYEPPYYLAYAATERQHALIAGKLGALHAVTKHTDRQAYVDVRVGSYDLDSSEDEQLDWEAEGSYEPSQLLPLTDDPGPIRHTLWLLTDLRYKQALSSYLKVRAQRVHAPPEEKRRPPSFSRATPVERFEPRVLLTYDEPRWRRVVEVLGREVGADRLFFDAEVQVDFRVTTRWFVNTEGAKIRTVQPLYAVHVSAAARADDGMLVEHSFDLYAPVEAGLPGDAELMARTKRMLAELRALRGAPVLEPYTGPAILEPAATGVFFHEVLGHRLEGHRQDRREEGQTFAAHLHQRILPPFLTVVDDPTLREIAGAPLNGYYQVDDEGVPSERVTLVDRGVLQGFLLHRRPVEGFERSNGHGRAQAPQRPVARMGNLIVVPHQTVPRTRLKEILLDEVRRQGKPYGLLVSDITGGATNTSSYGYQAFKGAARLVYKVDPATGQETLVRGVELVGTPLISIGKILAASDETGIFNGYCGAESGMVPVSAVAPATLFSEIELQRAVTTRAKSPILPNPSRTEGKP